MLALIKIVPAKNKKVFRVQVRGGKTLFIIFITFIYEKYFIFKTVFTLLQQKPERKPRFLLITSQFTCLSQIGYCIVFTQQQDKDQHFIISGTLKTKLTMVSTVYYYCWHKVVVVVWNNVSI